jgi:hypothetical protein
MKPTKHISQTYREDCEAVELFVTHESERKALHLMMMMMEQEADETRGR